MPSIEWNKQNWGQRHPWPAHGDEWSYSFGSASAHWYSFLLPRLHRLLPDAATPDSRIVEIAPGHGRWTHFLLTYCRKLAGYDLAEECVVYCRERFRDRVADGTAEFHRNDGLTLAEADSSVDLVFSFDSLVHVERDVMQSYLTHIARCLKPGGFAFLQHSNLGQYAHLYNYNNAGPFNARGVTVAAVTMQADAKERGLATLIQEGLNHETQQLQNELVDCISVFQKPAPGQIAGEPIVLNNAYYPAMGQLAKSFVLPYEACGRK